MGEGTWGMCFGRVMKGSWAVTYIRRGIVRHRVMCGDVLMNPGVKLGERVAEGEGNRADVVGWNSKWLLG